MLFLLFFPAVLSAAEFSELHVFYQNGHTGSGHFLANDDGDPFFYLGDTAWELFHRLDREETEYYLENRARKKFTVIQAVALAEFDGLNTPNRYGDLPLIDNDPARPAVTAGSDPGDADEYDYWDHVDWVVAKAEELGLYFGLLPTWGDKVVKKWGIGPVVFNHENARAYGEWLGKRYADCPNIIWILGGDRAPVDESVDYRPVFRAMAEGIRSADTNHLMTYHTMGGTTTSTWFHNDEWLDFNMTQSGHSRKNIDNYTTITHDYLLTPAKPCMDSEPCYEDHPVNWGRDNDNWFEAYDVRKAVYWSLFAGGHGVTYGCHDIWQFFQDAYPPVSIARTPWKTAIDLPGSFQMRHVRALMESRPMLDRIPDQSLIASDPGTGGEHIRAARAYDGSYAFVYIPTGRTVDVNIGALSGSAVNAYWFDPRSGETATIGTLDPGTSTVTFDPPGDHSEGNDWILILDNANKEFANP